MKNHRYIPFIILFLILLAAALFRVPGIYWGDRHLAGDGFARWHVDETTHINVAKGFLDGNINYRGRYVKGMGLQIAMGAIMGKMLSFQVSQNDLYRIGRWISFFYGLAIIVLLYFVITKISGDTSLALLSAGFLAFCSLAITNSHFAVADSAAYFWLWLTVFLCYLSINNSSKTAWLSAWAACGIGLSVKLTFPAGAALLATLVIKKDLWKDFLSGISILCTAFVFANGWGMGLDGFKGILNDITGDYLAVIPHHTMLETIFAFFVSLFPAFSFPLIILSATGAYMLFKYRRNDLPAWWCFGLPILAHAVMVVISDIPFERYLLPFAPVLCATAAFGWKNIFLARGDIMKKTFWSIPLLSYLIFFAIDGEMPFWRDNRGDARQWVLNEIDSGTKILEGPYAWLYLPGKRYELSQLNSRFLKDKKMDGFDWIFFHEAHTFRYERSRLSPFRKPSPDNIYHPNRRNQKFLKEFKEGILPFTLDRVFEIQGEWCPERVVYKKYWGTFQSFVGDFYVYKKSTPPISQ